MPPYMEKSHKNVVTECLMRPFYFIDFPQFADERGKLAFIEGFRHIPFNIARVYYLYDLPVGGLRGAHAHKDLEQVLIAISGQFRVVLHDGDQESEIWLNNPSKGLFTGKMLWHTMDSFSPNACVLVLASAPYDEADYIRNFDEFLRIVRGNAK